MHLQCAVGICSPKWWGRPAGAEAAFSHNPLAADVGQCEPSNAGLICSNPSAVADKAFWQATHADFSKPDADRVATSAWPLCLG